jgi:hypothetical protein
MTDDDKRAAVARVKAGETRGAVALDLGVSGVSVGQWVKRFGDSVEAKPAKSKRSKAEKPTKRRAASGSAAMVLVNARIEEAEALANTLANGRTRNPRFEKKERPGLRDGYLAARREIDLRKGLSDGAVPESRRLTPGGA